MKTCLTIFLIAIIPLLVLADISILKSTDSAGVVYNYAVSLEKIKESPSWEIEKSNLPLSIEKATKIALEWVSEKKDVSKKKLEIQDIGLFRIVGIQVPQNKWCYSIYMDVKDRVYLQHSNKTFSYTIVVLLDGTVVEPTVEKEHNSGEEWMSVP